MRGSDLDRLKEFGFKEGWECDLSEANLTSTDLSGIELVFANLWKADPTGAGLTGVNPRGLFSDTTGVWGPGFSCPTPPGPDERTQKVGLRYKRGPV